MRRCLEKKLEDMEKKRAKKKELVEGECDRGKRGEGGGDGRRGRRSSLRRNWNLTKVRSCRT